MDITHLLNIPATLTSVTKGEPDALNHATVVETDRQILCHVEPKLRNEENTDRQDVQRAEFLAFFDPSETVTGDDRLTVGSAVYELLGPPQDWFDPRTGVLTYITANIVRTA